MANRNVTREQYRTARKLIKDNGPYALRWLSARVASVMDELAAQRPDNLAEKADFLAWYVGTLPKLDGVTVPSDPAWTHGNLWNARAFRQAKRQQA